MIGCTIKTTLALPAATDNFTPTTSKRASRCARVAVHGDRARERGAWEDSKPSSDATGGPTNVGWNAPFPTAKNRVPRKTSPRQSRRTPFAGARVCAQPCGDSTAHDECTPRGLARVIGGPDPSRARRLAQGKLPAC
eukprot:scaffold65312_cov33-Tisochrysis_lutea.AAC.5